jgi:hypothetical protein
MRQSWYTDFFRLQYCEMIWSQFPLVQGRYHEHGAAAVLTIVWHDRAGEHGKLDFVAASFNALNHANVVALNEFYGPDNSPIPVFTSPNKAGTPRQLQFSIDFEF